jgi:hypothetical protein
MSAQYYEKSDKFRIPRPATKSSCQELYRPKIATQVTVLEQTGIWPARPSSQCTETYRSRLMEKLQLDDLSALIKFAIRHGITSLE